MGRFLLPLMARHDHERFEIFAYAQVAVPDALTRQFQSHADHWRSLAGLSDERAATLIRDDSIDILVDLSMHMADNRLLLFARKPAAGAGDLSGVRFHHRLVRDGLSPERSASRSARAGHRRRTIVRKHFRFPRLIGAISRFPARPLARCRALVGGEITFGCLNTFGKASAPAAGRVGPFAGVVPNSRLLLHAHEGSHRQRTAEMFQRLGVDPGRLRVSPGFCRCRSICGFISKSMCGWDPFPYGGGTTTCDALWMGVPVVSLAGKTGVGRGGLSILLNMGLAELVAANAGEYVRIAAALAGDLERLKGLRSTLRRRMEQSPLMDAPRFARHMEAAYREMWRKWCACRRRWLAGSVASDAAKIRGGQSCRLSAPHLSCDTIAHDHHRRHNLVTAPSLAVSIGKIKLQTR